MNKATTASPGQELQVITLDDQVKIADISNKEHTAKNADSMLLLSKIETLADVLRTARPGSGIAYSEGEWVDILTSEEREIVTSKMIDLIRKL